MKISIIELLISESYVRQSLEGAEFPLTPYTINPFTIHHYTIQPVPLHHQRNTFAPYTLHILSASSEITQNAS